MSLVEQDKKKQIESIYEKLMLEVSLLFFDGVQQKFPNSVDKMIDDLAKNHFIEYV